MRIVTSVSSIVFLSLTILSLTSCGKYNPTWNAKLNVNKDKASTKIEAYTIALCGEMIAKNGDITVKIDKDRELIQATITNYVKNTNFYSFELTIPRPEGLNISMNIAYSGFNGPFFSKFGMAECSKGVLYLSDYQSKSGKSCTWIKAFDGIYHMKKVCNKLED